MPDQDDGFKIEAHGTVTPPADPPPEPEDAEPASDEEE